MPEIQNCNKNLINNSFPVSRQICYFVKPKQNKLLFYILLKMSNIKITRGSFSRSDILNKKS